MTITTTDKLLDALCNLVDELHLRGMSKEQVLDLIRIARRLTVDAERRIAELKGAALWP